MVDTEKIVDYLSKKGVDFCDARFEKHHWFTIMIINGEIRSVSMDTLLGVSIRVLVDGSWGYASTTNLSWESIKETGDRAYRLAKSICGTRNKRLELEATTVSKHVKAKIKINPIDVDIKEKLEVLMALDKAQRDADKRVVNSNSAYSESISLFNLSNSLGANISWNEIRTRIVAYPIVAEEGKMQSSFFVRDGTKGFE
ncbi:MAG: PmbA/TldA family metallopeptidase, partial [Candidatus Njordarchaeota archaeon]